MRFAVLLAGLALAPAAAASAAPGSLLSGYGGPGDGEQALLGQTLLLGGSSGAPSTPGVSGSGSGAAAGANPAPSADALFAPADPKGTGASGRPAARSRGESRPKPAGSSHRRQAARPSAAPVSPSHAARPAVVARPGAAPAAVSSRELALVLLVAAALAALGVAARRLAVRAARERRSALQAR